MIVIILIWYEYEIVWNTKTLDYSSPENLLSHNKLFGKSPGGFVDVKPAANVHSPKLKQKSKNMTYYIFNSSYMTQNDPINSHSYLLSLNIEWKIKFPSNADHSDPWSEAFAIKWPE